MCYVPPKTRAWSEVDYHKMLDDTVICLQKMVSKSDNILVMGDFNCKEVQWEDWSTEGGGGILG